MCPRFVFPDMSITKLKKYFLRVYHSCDLVGLKEITIEKKRITWKIQKKLALLRILQTHLPSNVTFNIHVPSLNMNKSIKFLTVSINQLSKNWLFSRVDILRYPRHPRWINTLKERLRNKAIINKFYKWYYS